MRLLVFGVVALFLFSFGCLGSVDDTASDNSSITQTYICPDGNNVSNLADCNKCQVSCNDGNPCTKDFCGEETDYTCKHENLDGEHAGCYGGTEVCKSSICSLGECIQKEESPCCGNSICEDGEDCSTCNKDCGCGENEACVFGVCKVSECITDSDCDDGNTTTNDSCVRNETGTSCQHTKINQCMADGICEKVCPKKLECVIKCGVDRSCQIGCNKYTDPDCIPCDLTLNDSFCPDNCTALTDINCQVFSTLNGGYGESKDGKIKMSVSSSCSSGVTKIKYNIYNAGETDIYVSTDMLAYFYRSNSKSLRNTSAFYYKIIPGYEYSSIYSIFGVYEDGRFVYYPSSDDKDIVVYDVGCK